jgi:hypothetical protein
MIVLIFAITGDCAMCPDPDPVPIPPSEPKLLDQIRGRLRVKHYKYPHQSYVDWVRRFVVIERLRD